MLLRSFLAMLVALPLVLHSQLRTIDTLWVEQTLSTMTLDQKIGHLLMPAHRSVDATKEFITKYHVGSIWFAKAEPRKLIAELNELQQLAPCGLLVAGDFEKGIGTHVDGATDFPIAMALGASGDPKLAYEAAAVTAAEARAIGVHLNFAPVVDVNSNPQNPVINIRAFGDDPALVGTMGLSVVRGYEDNGLLATLKHYPGHGNTGIDTHSDLAAIDGNKGALDQIELAPYRFILAQHQSAAVMVSHLWMKAYDESPLPATFSKRMIGEVLRGEMHFQGIVCTDAMTMGAITKHYSAGDAAVRAVEAGVDLIVWPADVPAAFEALRSAVESGRIPQAQLDGSVRRILNAKTRVGLQTIRTIDPAKAQTRLGTSEHLKIARAIARKCVKVQRDDRGLLPLPADRRFLVVTFNNRSGAAMMSRTLESFPEEFKQLAFAVETVAMTDGMSDQEQNAVLEKARTADIVIVAAYVRIFLSSGTVGLPAHQQRFLESLVRTNPKVVLVSFGNPYIGASVPAIPTFITAFDNAAVLQEAVAERLFEME